MRPSDEHSRDGDKNGYDVNPPFDYRFGDQSDGQQSIEETQAGVKRIEAVSRSWTLTSLVVAYVTYVSFFGYFLSSVFKDENLTCALDLCLLQTSPLWRYRLPAISHRLQQVHSDRIPWYRQSLWYKES